VLRRSAPSFSEEKEAKRLLRPRGGTPMFALAGSAMASAKNKSFLVLFFKKERLSFS
jgi:hypothetical protein